MFAKAPAAWFQAHSIVDNRLLGKGLLRIHIGLGPDGLVKLLIIWLIHHLRCVGIADICSAFASSPNFVRPRYMTHDEHVLHTSDVAPLANLAATAKIFNAHALPTVLGHVWLI
jgi:hypothetical protein